MQQALRADGTEALWRTALRLRRRADRRKAGRRVRALPPLLYFTDGDRTPDPEAVIARLPRGAGVVYRSFGASDSVEQGRRLLVACRRRGVVFIVGADARVAQRLGAFGLHLPESRAGEKGRILALGRRFRISVAAHGLPGVLKARGSGADTVVISPVFPSRSPSARRTLGHRMLAGLARRSQIPAYALGGVNPRTARKLEGTGVGGVAAVDGLVGRY